MLLVAGLGNPGPEYEGTRHNVGFEVVDAVAREAGIRLRGRECQALVGRGAVAGVPLLLAQPQTYMNASGEAVAGLLKKYGLEREALLVVSDDIDLPLGALRLRPGGSAGGQKGLRSIVQCLGSQEFPRLRVGIRGATYTRERLLEDYVLERFRKDEREAAQAAVAQASEAVRAWIAEGIVPAMNRFNAVPESPGP